MSTKTHADGIKTIVHTSKWAEDRQANFLRRTSPSDIGIVDFFRQNTASAEAEAHQREHDRIVHCRSIGLPE